MSCRIALQAVAALAAALLAGAAHADDAVPLAAGEATEAAVLAELNRARADPAGYAAALGGYRRFYQGHLIRRPGAKVVFETEEGVAPLDEAVAYLAGRADLAALAAAPTLAAAAADHRADQGADGAVGHAGRDGSNAGDRVARRGGGIYVGEVIAYGAEDPADVVRQLVIDDGVPDRGHRRLLFAADLAFAGVACGPHPVYRTMCVIDLARTADGRPRGRTQLASR